MEKTSEIKQLGPVVKALGYHNKLLKRIGRVVIYEAYMDDRHEKLDGYFVGLVRVNPESIFPDGRVSKAKEVFFQKSKGGFDVFFYMRNQGKGLVRAEKKFDELLDERCPAVINQSAKIGSGKKRKRKAAGSRQTKNRPMVERP